jgi:hypothetical protein
MPSFKATIDDLSSISRVSQIANGSPTPVIYF